MPPGIGVSGLESDGSDQFFCGGESSGKVRAVRRTRRVSAAGSGSDASQSDIPPVKCGSISESNVDMNTNDAAGISWCLATRGEENAEFTSWLRRSTVMVAK